MNINEKTIERTAYRLIRKEASRLDRAVSDSELANYVRAVVNLETELYEELIKTESIEVDKEVK